MSSREKPERLTYTVEEAALVLGISRAFAYECVARGEIPTIEFGKRDGKRGRILVPKELLHRMIKGGSVPAEGSPDVRQR